jgi:hypothetical protein
MICQVFVIDNSVTCSTYQHRITFVVETLFKKIIGIDEDGVDMYFTNGNPDRYVRKAKSPEKLTKALRNPRNWHDDKTYTTEMDKMLHNICDEYLNHHAAKPKMMTLFILTDGIWQGTVDKSKVECQIAEFLKNLQQKWRPQQRHFTIQFIRFGDDADAIRKLDELDDLKQEGVP